MVELAGLGVAVPMLCGSSDCGRVVVLAYLWVVVECRVGAVLGGDWCLGVGLSLVVLFQQGRSGLGGVAPGLPSGGGCSGEVVPSPCLWG